MRRLRIALYGLILVAAVAAGWTVLRPRLQAGLETTFGQGDYALTATDGTTFTQASLTGAPSAVFFGFTHCPEVCPTTLGDIATWQAGLGDAGPLRTYFVTVDPERDTLPLLRDYVGWLPGAVGVTGPPEEVQKAIRAFRVYARKVPLKDGGYTMDHSATILLFDARGRMVEPIGYQEDTARAEAKIRRLMSGDAAPAS